MYIYTHILVGSALGAWLEKSRPGVVLGALGGLLPDVPMGTQAVRVILKGSVPRNIKWNKSVITASDALHSLPLCALLLLAGKSKAGLRSLAWSMTAHSVMDVMSHAVTPKFKATYLWPLPWQLGKWLSIWEYRRSGGRPTPKPLEIAMGGGALIYLLFRIRK